MSLQTNTLNTHVRDKRPDNLDPSVVEEFHGLSSNELFATQSQAKERLTSRIDTLVGEGVSQIEVLNMQM